MNRAKYLVTLVLLFSMTIVASGDKNKTSKGGPSYLGSLQMAGLTVSPQSAPVGAAVEVKASVFNQSTINAGTVRIAVAIGPVTDTSGTCLVSTTSATALCEQLLSLSKPSGCGTWEVTIPAGAHYDIDVMALAGVLCSANPSTLPPTGALNPGDYYIHVYAFWMQQMQSNGSLAVVDFTDQKVPFTVE